MVTIGIPTYNRLQILKTMSESLYASDINSSHNIKVYDDCSDEYDLNDLRQIFPSAVSIIRNTENMKADKNNYQMYQDFLSSSDEYFFNADSDLIFHPHWLETALELIQKNRRDSFNFQFIFTSASKNNRQQFLYKKTIGAAGTLFTRRRVEELVLEFTGTENFRSFDWRWSEYFLSGNTPIYCTNTSLVQHIGYIGQNSGQKATYSFDFGRNFKVTSVDQGQIINDIFESFLIAGFPMIPYRPIMQNVWIHGRFIFPDMIFDYGIPNALISAALCGQSRLLKPKCMRVYAIISGYTRFIIMVVYILIWIWKS
jgi:glycosyltransferase involved in cell wall biosynthesis